VAAVFRPGYVIHHKVSCVACHAPFYNVRQLDAHQPIHVPAKPKRVRTRKAKAA
jgi:hypothetical protein